MRLCKLVPNQCLRPYVSRYWVWENESVLPKIFSGTGTELMFHYGESLTGTNQSGKVFTLPKCYIMSPRFKYYQLYPGNQLGFISIRFRAGAFRHFCKNPVTEFVDSFVDIEELWGSKGLEFKQQVMVAENLRQRIAVIEKFLMCFLIQYHKSEQSLDTAIQTLLYDYKSVRLQDLCRNLFLSQRQLERKFKEAVGVTPKAFQKISRFEAVVKHLLLCRSKNYLDEALGQGYYDQSHFLKEFKNYIGEYPTSFLQEENFMSHFYNEKLPNGARIDYG
jgi:AraC-like DNA-binding protein